MLIEILLFLIAITPYECFFKYKKTMLIEILLFLIAITPYIIIFMFLNVLFDIIEDRPNETFDVVDTPAEAFEKNNNNRQKLIDLINQGKAHLLPGKTP